MLFSIKPPVLLKNKMQVLLCIIHLYTFWEGDFISSVSLPKQTRWVTVFLHKNGTNKSISWNTPCEANCYSIQISCNIYFAFSTVSPKWGENLDIFKSSAECPPVTAATPNPASPITQSKERNASTSRLTVDAPLPLHSVCVPLITRC